MIEAGRPVTAHIWIDGIRLVADAAFDEVEPREPHHESSRGVDVGFDDARADDGHADEPCRRGAGAGIDDVRTLLVGARGRDGEIGREDHAYDLVSLERMADADAPRRPWRAMPSGTDIAGRVDEVIAEAVGVEDRRGARDRPAFHESRGVEPASIPGAEVTLCVALETPAQLDDFLHKRIGALQREAPSAYPRDLALRQERAEEPVDAHEIRVHVVERTNRPIAVPEVDGDRHSHHLFCAPDGTTRGAPL